MSDALAWLAVPGWLTFHACMHVLRGCFSTEPIPTLLPGALCIQGLWQLAGGHGREVYEDLEGKLSRHAEAGFTAFE